MPGVNRIIKRDALEVNDVFAFESTSCNLLSPANVIFAALMLQAKEQVAAGELDAAVRSYHEILTRYPTSEAAARARREIVLYRGLAKAGSNSYVIEARDRVIKTARALQRFRDRNGRWPESLEQLTPSIVGEYPADPRGRAFEYLRKAKGRGYVLACLGADGVRGGHGEAGDIFVEDGEFVMAPSMSWP